MRIDVGGKVYLKRFDRGLTVPAVGRFYRLLHDHELEEYGYTNRMTIPYPSTRQFWRKPDSVPFGRVWQEWYYEVLNIASGRLLSDTARISVWRDVTADHVAFFDRHSWMNGYTDYVQGLRGIADMEIITLGMTGNLVEVLGTEYGYLKIRALDALKSPPDPASFLKDNAVCHWATEASIQDRRFVIANFPKFEPFLGAGWGVPVPVMSLGGSQLVHPTHVERVTNGTAYSIYL